MKRTFQISPNLSLSPEGALMFYLTVVTATALVSGSVALQGYWPVLPFAGLELGLLGWVLWSVQKRGRYREVLTISADTVVVEKGESEVSERVEFARHWAGVEMRATRGPSSASRLSITAHGRRCVIGECLTEVERRSLARRLVECIGPHDSSPALLAGDE
ncbi:MAG: DUF2244 domain-containing protein [Pseudomonadota bacterium]